MDLQDPPDGKRLLEGYPNKVQSLKSQICAADIGDLGEQNAPADKNQMQNEETEKYARNRRHCGAPSW